MEHLPEWAKDEVHTRVEIHLGLLDKLKLLLGFRLSLNVSTFCQNEPGRVSSTSDVRVWRPRKPVVAKESRAEATPGNCHV